MAMDWGRDESDLSSAGRGIKVLLFVRRLVFEFPSKVGLNEAVWDDTGHSGVGDAVVPLAHMEQVGDRGDARIRTVIADLDQIAAVVAHRAGSADVIDGPKWDSG